MALTIQEMFDCIDNLSKNKLVLVLEGKEGNNKIYSRIYIKDNTCYLDVYSSLNTSTYINRIVEDISNLSKFKVHILSLLRKYSILKINIE
ncbi:MAG: hypothetical protein MJA82_18020 [Clostridia bacterium]|nr:hypothetical protein [Clostridia bacterium]